MVIVTGRSSTHIKALSDSVAKKVKEAGLDILGMEGKLQSEWILVDVGGVVVHIMLGSVRALYNLEDLWGFDASKGAARTGSAGSLLQTHENAITVSRHQDGGLGGRGHRALQQAHRAGDEFLSY